VFSWKITTRYLIGVDVEEEELELASEGVATATAFDSGMEELTKISGITTKAKTTFVDFFVVFNRRCSNNISHLTFDK
jgi:hypothetical protein